MLKVFFCRNPIIIILLQIILGLTICVLVAHAAPSSKDSEGREGRQGRTLGLLTVGAQALSSGVGTAGKILGATVAGIAAVKPLILLGGAKCKLRKKITDLGRLIENFDCGYSTMWKFRIFLSLRFYAKSI